MSSDRRRLLLTHNSKISVNTEGRYLIDKLIPRRDLTVAWGTPKSGKTFWALDVAFHIAMGVPYRGLKVEQGPVVYCAFEGQHGIRDRVAAYHTVNQGSDTAPLWFMLERFTFTRPGVSSTRKHRELITSIREHEVRPALVVLDTLNRSLDGSESSDEDMTFYTKAAEEIGDSFECAVLIVHHCGINTERPRGHTSLTGTCACQISIRRVNKIEYTDRILSAKVEFIKDGPEGKEFGYFLKQVQLGHDQDGNEISSCILADAPNSVLDLAKRGTTPIRSSQTTKVLALLQPMCDRADDGLVPLSHWREVAMQSNIVATKNIDSKRKAFLRAVDNLCEEGVVKIEGEMVKLVRI